MASMQQALQAFREHRAYKAGNVQSTGTSLLSYGWWELAKWVDDGHDPHDPHNDPHSTYVDPTTGQHQHIVVRVGPAPSISTACQRTRLGLYRWTAATNPTPRTQGAMNV